MTRSEHDATIQIEDDGGHVLATAEVTPTDAGVVHSDLHVESGHLPMGTRTRLVDAVLEHPAVGSADTLVATMPISDTEMLDRVRERADGVEARAAGATKIVEAHLDRES
jgi:ethanolamine utilization microcompartment shell protein EutS